MKKLDGVEVTTFTDAAAFDSWLSENPMIPEASPRSD